MFCQVVFDRGQPLYAMVQTGAPSPYENPATKPYLFLDAQSSQGNELSSSFMTMELSFRAGI